MPDSESERIRHAVDGDRDALAALLAEYGPQVRERLAARIGRQWQGLVEPDDVLQVTYLDAFVRIERFQDQGAGAFLAWLTQIAMNNLRDGVRELERAKRPDPRKRVRQPAKTEDSAVALVDMLGYTSTTPSRAAAGSEIKHVLDAVLQRLPPDYETVIRLYDLEGKPAADVGAALNRSEGAVYMLHARALDQLRELIGSESRFFSRKA